jgi:hypothetical protein
MAVEANSIPYFRGPDSESFAIPMAQSDDVIFLTFRNF